jgi:hypothetical protein
MCHESVVTKTTKVVTTLYIDLIAIHVNLWTKL